jgi:hypothetical protein
MLNMKIFTQAKSLIVKNSNRFGSLRTRLPAKPSGSIFAAYFKQKCYSF